MGHFVDVESPIYLQNSVFDIPVDFPDKKLLSVLYSSLQVFKNAWLHVLSILSWLFHEQIYYSVEEKSFSYHFDRNRMLLDNFMRC